MTAGNTDEVKGRVEEAAGVLAGDESLKRRGRLDQARHTIKEVVDRLFNRLQGSHGDRG